MNGYPTKILHGDWYAGKGIGICQLEIQNMNVTVCLSHFHAKVRFKSNILFFKLFLNNYLWISLGKILKRFFEILKFCNLT